MGNKMKIIKKKCWPKYFEAMFLGKKNYEFRLDDFEINEGDKLVLKEWDPKIKHYTGRKIEKEVIEKGIQIISLK